MIGQQRKHLSPQCVEAKSSAPTIGNPSRASPKTSREARETYQLCFLCKVNPRDKGAKDPRLIFGSLHVAAQPEGIVGHTTRHYQRRAAQLQNLIARGQQAEGINRSVGEYPRVLAVTS